jgi:hypothetical protein
MLVPVLIFFACFGLGITASARWLPDLEPGTIGGLALFTVSGLLGAALCLAGLGVYSIVREIHELGGGLLTNGKVTTASGDILADGMRNILLECGTVVGLAGIVYLLAPPAPDEPAAGELPPTVSVAEADG